MKVPLSLKFSFPVMLSAAITSASEILVTILPLAVLVNVTGAYTLPLSSKPSIVTAASNAYSPAPAALRTSLVLAPIVPEKLTVKSSH